MKCMSDRNVKGVAAEEERRPEAWPEPPAETQISHSRTVTSEESPLFTVTAADESTSPPAPCPHTTGVQRCYLPPRDEAGGGTDVCISAWVPQDKMVLTYFTAGSGLKYKYCKHQMLLFSVTFNITFCIEKSLINGLQCLVALYNHSSHH